MYIGVCAPAAGWGTVPEVAIVGSDRGHACSTTCGNVTLVVAHINASGRIDRQTASRFEQRLWVRLSVWRGIATDDGTRR